MFYQAVLDQVIERRYHSFERHCLNRLTCKLGEYEDSVPQSWLKKSFGSWLMRNQVCGGSSRLSRLQFWFDCQNFQFECGPKIWMGRRKIFTDCSLYSDTTNISISGDSSYLSPLSQNLSFWSSESLCVCECVCMYVCVTNCVLNNFLARFKRRTEKAGWSKGM